MKPILTVFAASLVLSWPILPAVHAAPVSDRSAIQAALDLSNKGLLDKDAKESASCEAPDCINKDTDGKITTHQQSIDIATKIFAITKFVSAKTTILTFSIKDGKAYVTTKSHMVGNLINPETKQQIGIIGDATDSETWRKIAGQWKQIFCQTTSDNFQPQSPAVVPPGQGT